MAKSADALRVEDRNWHEKYALLSARDLKDLAPAELRELSQAAWWTGHLDDAIQALETSFRIDLAAGNVPAAAKDALDLVSYYGHKLNASMTQGWLSRAERLLEGQPECPAHAFLERARANRCLNANQLDEALVHAREMTHIGERLGDLDLQALGLHMQGIVHVARGEVATGTALLDEAAVPAVNGELSPMATSTIYCNIIATCSDLADYRRAGEWTEAARRWCDRQAITGFPGHCRVFRAEIIRLRGDWPDAEREAQKACDELNGFSPRFAGEAFHELGEIRLRMGDFAGAREAFGLAIELGNSAQPGHALLDLREGHPSTALAAIQRAVDDEGDRLYRARLLPALVEIAIEAGELPRAAGASGELHDIARTFNTPGISACAYTVAGMVALAGDDPVTAVSELSRAHRLWVEVDLPYEAARATFLLVRAYAAQGNATAAASELNKAITAFERLGATADESDARHFAESSAQPAPAAATERQQRAFLFSDIVDSTRLLEAIGDEAWEPLLSWHDKTLREAFAAHEGEEIKHAGDGFFVAFPDASIALACAAAIQKSLAEHRRKHGFAPQVRIGVHAAEATRRGNDFAGKGVHVAARIGALAQAGEIVVSVQSCAEVAGYVLLDQRAVTLKGIGAPIDVANVDWAG